MSVSDIHRALSLSEAAQRMGVPFVAGAKPHDGTVMAGNMKLHYLHWGNENGEPLVFLHGMAQQAHSWDFISGALSNRYRILVLDARGHGDSQWPEDGDYSIEAHQRDLDAFVQAMSLERFILIGHSMGGRNGYVFASRRPEKIKALVIVDTGPESTSKGSNRIRKFVTLPDELDSYDEFAQRIHDYTGRPLWSVYGSLKYTIRQLPNGKWTWKYDKAIRSGQFKPPSRDKKKLWKCLERIQCPTLVMKGVDSDIFLQEMLDQMLAVIPNSIGTLVAESGHSVHGDNPVGFLAALEPFLEGLT